MAFAWDDLQEKWLDRHFAGRCRSFAAKVPVAGSTLEIDALAEEPEPDELFDFLSPLNIIRKQGTWPGVQRVRPFAGRCPDLVAHE